MQLLGQGAVKKVSKKNRRPEETFLRPLLSYSGQCQWFRSLRFHCRPSEASQGGFVDDTKWLMAQQIPRLRRYALSLTGNAEEADDLVQDCLERAIRKKHLWHQHGSIRAWLFKILYRIFLNQAAQRNARNRSVQIDETVTALSEPARQEMQLVCKDIAAAMQRLPVEQRAAIALTAVEGFPYDEAAGVLGVPVGTLRSRLFRGREMLRDLYVAPAAKQVPLRRVK